jgi:NAD(P)-dependent dehydrogenase (short-subunit alcohol dehydrogenase family)
VIESVEHRAPDLTGVFQSDMLAGKTILITGASSGIGKRTATALAQSGARLVLAGRDEQRLIETQQSLPGCDHVSVIADLNDADSAADFVKTTAKQHGIMSGIFHSAGLYAMMPSRTVKQKLIDSLYAASVWGAYGIARAASSKHVLADGGSFVIMSSVAGLRGHPATSVYGGAKAAIVGLVQPLAIEFAARGVRVNAIAAGIVESRMQLETLANLPPEVAVESQAQYPLGFGTMTDVAGVVVFLMSDAGRWITGTTVTVDGGYMAS